MNRIGAVLVETYRIERLIAEGGMGSVYQAAHVRLPKRFAVKFLNVNLVGNIEALLRFRREAEIVAALDHPNIVSLLDYNLTDDGVPYVVLEFLDGEHLGRRIERGKLSLGEVMRILVSVAQGLAFAHKRDIVHRDLKPENIILSRGGEQVKVVDFGIAKIRGGLELTGHNAILGTVPYMAPEQLLGGTVDQRCDQFALGSLVYEMLTGEMAFGGDSVPAAAARVAHHQPGPIDGVAPSINRALARALAKTPNDRFPSVEAFARAMIEAASERPEPRVDAPAVIIDPSAMPAVIVAVSEPGLPPLAGEATAITPARPRRSRMTPFDDDDEVADPPESRRKREATDPSAAPSSHEPQIDVGFTQEMPAVTLGWEDATGQVGPVEAMANAATAIGPAPSHAVAADEAPTPQTMDVAAPPLDITHRVVKSDPEPNAAAPSVAPPIDLSAAETRPSSSTSAGSTAWILLLLAGVAGAAAGIWLFAHH